MHTVYGAAVYITESGKRAVSVSWLASFRKGLSIIEYANMHAVYMCVLF